MLVRVWPRLFPTCALCARHARLTDMFFNKLPRTKTVARNLVARLAKESASSFQSRAFRADDIIR